MMKQNYRVLKALPLILLIQMVVSGSFAQINTSTGALWNAPGNWSLGHIPLPAEDVVINTNMTMNMPAGLFTVNSITVNTTRTLTIGSSTTAQTIDVTTFVTTLGTGVINIGAFDALHSLTIGGTLTNAGTLSLGTSAIRACNVTLNGTAITGNGAYTFNNLVIGGSVTNNSTSTINVRGDLTSNNTFTSTAGAISFMGAVAQNLNGTTNPSFNNLDLRNAGTGLTVGGSITGITVGGALTMNASGTPTLNLGTTLTSFSVTGAFTMAGGAGTTFDFGTTVTKTVTIGGNFTPQTITMQGVGLAHQLILGGATNSLPTAFNTTVGSGSIVEYNNATSQTVFASLNYQFLKLSGGGTKTFSGVTTTNNDLNITGTGVLVSNANALTVGGNLNNAGTGTTTWGGNANTLTLTGDLVVTNNTTFTLGNAQAKTLNVLGNVQVDAGSTINVAAVGLTHSLAIGGTLTNAGTFSMWTSNTGPQVCNVTLNGTSITGNGAYTFYNLTINGAVANNSTSTINVRGNLTLNNTFNNSAGAVNFTNNIAQTISGAFNATFNDLGFTGGAGVKTWGSNANTFSVTGNLLVTNNTTFTIGNTAGQTKTLNVTGNVQVDAGSTMNVGVVNATHILTIGGPLTNAGTFNMWNAAAQLCNVTLNGTAITGNGTYTFNNLIINGAVTNNSTSALNVRGDLTLNNTLTCSAGTFNFNGGVQNILGTANANFNNLNFSGGAGAKTWGDNANIFTVNGNLLVTGNTPFTIGNTAGQNKTLNVTGNVQVDAGSTMSIGAFDALHSFTIGGTLTNAGTLTLETSAVRACNVTLSGTSITGNGAYTFNNLIINGAVTNNSTSSLNIFGDLTLDNIFTCTAGGISFRGAVAQNLNGTTNPTFNNLDLRNAGTAVTVGGTLTGVTVNGALTMNASGTPTLNLGTTLTSFSVTGAFTMAGGAGTTFDFGTTVAKTVTIGGNFTPQTITMQGVGLAHQLILGGATNSLPTAFNTTVGSGSIVEYNNATSQTVFASLNYQFLKLSGGGTKTFSGVTTTNNDLNITGTGVLVSNANALTVGGNLNNAGTGTTTWGGNANTLTLTGDLVVTNNTTFTLGNAQAKTLNVLGNVQVEAGSMINVAAIGLTHSLAIGGTLTNAGTFSMWTSNTGPQVCNVTLNGTSITGNGAYTFYNLTINGAVTNNSTSTINVRGNLTLNNTFNNSAGAVNFTNNIAQTISGAFDATFNDLGFTGGNAKTWVSNANTISVTGNLLVTNTTTFTIGNIAGQIKTLDVTGNVQVDAGSTINLGADAVHSFTVGGTLTNAGTLTLGASATRVCNVTLNGTAITGDGAYTFNNLTINGVVTNNSYSTINIRGNLTLNNTLTCTAGGISFMGAVAQNLNGTTNPTFNNLDLRNAGTVLTVGGTLSDIIVSGALTMNGASTPTLNLGTTLTSFSVAGAFTMAGGAGTIFNFGTSVAKVVTIGGNFTPQTITMQGAGLAHQLILGGATNPLPVAFNTTAGSGSVVEYNAAGAQSVFASLNYINLKISGTGTKTLGGAATVGDVLTLSASVLEIGNFNLTLTNSGAAAIAGGPFSATTMISTNGSGYLVKNAASAQALNPIGAGGFYSPMTLSSIAPNTGTYRVRAVPTALNPGYINVYWDFVTSIAGKTITATCEYDPSQYNSASQTISYTPAPYTAVQNPPVSGASSFGANSFTITGNVTATTGGYWTMGTPQTYYSYQTGDWNTPTTWTSDPSGTTQIGSTIPGYDDDVVILAGRTVSLPGNIATQNLNITINSTGFLDMSTFSFSAGLTTLSGQGTLRLASVNFPAVVTNTFVNSGGGTVEYYNASSFNLPVAQTTYNHLNINSAGQTATQLMNLTLNGNLSVKSGTFQINDNSSARRQLTINGNVTVNSGAAIGVGNGVTNTVTNPTAIAATAGAPFIGYYDLHSHRVVINGDFTNNGTVNFSNISFPVYNSFPPTVLGATTGFATVYFRGSTNNVLTCNGATNFYNLVVDKGSDQTYTLTVNPSVYSNFKLLGANNAAADVTGASATNPNIKKALWIRNGTLVLQGSTIIPSLSEGNITAALPATSDYFIPANGALYINGPDVVVLTTADDYDEVNTSYSVAGGSGLVNGVLQGGYSSLYVYGKLQISDGYLSTRESGGIVTNGGSGQIIINGGNVDAKQFLNATGSTASFQMTSGLFALRGRFQRTPSSYASITNLIDNSSTTINTARALNGTTTGFGTFNLNNTSNIFNMSGGDIWIYDVCDAAPPATAPFAFDVQSSAANRSVTGGTLTMIPTTGTVLADETNYRISSTAPLSNLVINQASGTSAVQLNTGFPLTVLSDVTIQSGVLDANATNLTIGGNFSIASGTSYVANGASANTTIFNGTGTQTLTINTAGALDINNLTLTKTAGVAVNLSGSQNTVNLAGNLTITLGTLNDNGKSVFVGGNVFNSGLHTGAGKISLNGSASTQTIDGNGVFQNLELNNTNAAAAPVSLLNNLTINGALTFSQDKLFNINAYNLRFNASASVINAGPLRFVQTAGNAGDGGITRVYSSTAAFAFPLGAASTSHVGVPEYTPASIGFGVAPSVYGSITVKPVGYAHPNATTAGRSLSYFWRVSSSGFTMGPATVTHGYTYSVNDVITGGDITENEYVAARYFPSTSTWTKGTLSDLDIVGKQIGEPGTGSFLENVGFIDGDYTAGDDNPIDPFGTPKTFYSFATGAWGVAANWTTNPDHVTYSNPGNLVPGASDIVVIGNNHTISLGTPANYLINPDTDPRSCATLIVKSGAKLDVRYNPSSNFGLVQSHSGGNGTIRITTAQGSVAAPQTFANPLGDFSDFNANLGTTELYTTNPAAGTTFYLKNGVSTYGNLLFSPLGGSNIIFPNNDVTILGNCTATGQNAASWLLPTWNVPYPTAPTAVIAKTITIMGNLDIQGGSFGWYGNGAIAENVVVKGNVTICDVCAFGVFGGATNQTLTIGGSLINNGNASTTGVTGADFRSVPLIFDGTSSASITNTAGTPVTTLGRVTVNKGNSQTTTLTLDIGGTLTQNITNNWLTLQNGTFRYQRVDPVGDFVMSAAANLTIPSTAGLYIDYSNANNRNVLIANNGSDASDLLLSGKLTLVRGNVYVGPTGFPGNNNDIEYSGNTASIQIDGGNLFVNGQIRRSTATTNGALTYTQSGGAVTINGNGGTATALTRAKLEVVNTGSQFNMSAGTLTIVRGGGTTFGDLFIRPSSSSVTGGEIIFTNVVPTTLQNYSMDANVALYNLTVTGAAAQNATVSLTTNPLVLNGSLTLTNASSFFNSNSRNVTINQDLVNNGVPGSYVFGTNLTTFSGSTQNISGTSVTNFYDLTVSPSISLGVNNNFTVNRNLTIGSGSLLLNTFKVTLLTNGSFVNNGAYTDDNVTGGVSLGGTSQQQISGGGSFNRLEINNAAGALLLNTITLDHDLVMTSGVFNIQSNNLILNTTSSIGGAPFSATKMIITDGVATSLGLTKFFPVIGATTLFTFPLGVASKYTPAELTINANGSIGYINVSPVNSYQPTVLDPTKVLDYYFSVSSSGITGFNGSMVLNYSSGDVNGTESDYVASWLQLPGTFWSKAAVGSGTDNVDESTNQILFSYPAGTSNLNGDYTAGEDGAIPAQVPTYISNSDGDWSDNTIWTPVGASPPCPAGGPNGYFVIIQHNVATDVNNCFAYNTVIQGTGQLSILSPTFGHNFGTVTGDASLGTGTVYLENGNLPAGNFTSFLDCTGDGTLEYGGTGTYAIVLNGFTTIPNLTVSGTGTRVLPNTDLTICDKLVIDGPTLDNSVTNIKLTINGSMERYNTGAFLSGSGATATVSFSGSAAQTVGGATGDFNGANKFNNLEINNSAGLSIGAAGNIEVNGSLLLTDGIITTSLVNTLSILNTSASAVLPTGGSATSFVSGPLKKQIVNGGSFVYPLGQGSVKGHTFTFTSTSTGTTLFTAEYFTPNPAASLTAPLVVINQLEYWAVTTTAAKTGKVDIAWDAQSNLNGTMTQNGITDLQVAEYNGSSWVGLPSITSGTNNIGDAQTTNSVSLSTTSKNYSLGSITSTKPIATLSPTGPVCGASGIPVSFTTHTIISLNYTISYNFNGVPQTPIVVSSLPFTLPTPASGTYQLTGFSYNNSTLAGVVDPTIITTYAAPTTSVAGSNQSLCNATSLNLSGNNPAVGTGLWTIVSGTGGWFNTPDATNYNALFGGPPGQTYTLRWTITNGLCTSSSTVVISFPYAPVQPSPFTAAPSSVCKGSSGIIYTVPPVAGAISYNWSYSDPFGAIITGSSNSVSVAFSPTANSGTMSVSAVNGCGPGAARSVAVTTVTAPVATFSYAASPYCQNAVNPSPTFSGGGVAGVFSSTAGLVFVSTATGEVNLGASTPGTYTVTNTIATGGACGTIVATNPITIITNGQWLGINSDWFNTINWNCGIIPTSTIDVVVPTGVTQPVIGGAGAVCRSITINNGASLTINGANGLDVYGSWQNNGSFTPNSSTVTFNGTGTIGGTSATTFNHLTISATGNVTAPTTSVTLSGDWINNGSFAPLTGTVAFTGTGSITGSSVTSFNNVIISGTGNITATANADVSGNWTNSGTFSASAGTITFNASGAQSLSGLNSFSGLAVNKPSGNLTLTGTGPTTVAADLNLVSGNLVSSTANSLSLGSATLTGGSATSYISGPMSKVIASSVSFTAPLGSVTASRYRPATISNTSAGPLTWSFEYVGQNPTSGSYPNKTLNTAALGTVSEFEYWLISPVLPPVGFTADVTLAYGAGSYNGASIGTLANLRVGRWNPGFVPSAAWDLPPVIGISSNGFLIGSTTVAGDVRVTNASDFGVFTLASTDSPSPLPITLLSFTAKVISDGIKLQWTTASELNNDYFEVEKLNDQETYESIGKVKGQGTTSKQTKYQYVDEYPTPATSYYRLKQVDQDGRYTYSSVISVDYGGPYLVNVMVYPNPATGDDITLVVKGIKDRETLPVSVYDALGRQFISEHFEVDTFKGSVERTISVKEMANGVYFFRIGEDNALVKKIIIAR